MLSLWLFLSAVSLTFSLSAYCQYFPGPTPVSPTMEQPLLAKLKGQLPDKDRLHTLLNLTNLYYNKPLKLTTDLNKGLLYGKQAKDLSTSLYNLSAYNNAQLLMAYIFIEKDNMTQAKNILPAVNDTTRVNLLLALSFKYLSRSSGENKTNQDSAMIFVQQAKILADKLHQKLNAITCLTYMGDIHASLGNWQLGEQELLKAITEYKKIGYPKLQYAYLELADVYNSKSDFTKTLSCLLQAEASMHATADYYNAGDIYSYLVGVMVHNAQHQEALNYAEKAFESFKLHPGYLGIDAALQRLVKIYISTHDYHKALAFMLENYKKYPPKDDYRKGSYLGTIGDCYLKLKQFDKAEVYFKEEFNLYKASNSLSERAYHRMAFFYVESKQYALAKPYLLAALKQQKGINIGGKNHLHYMLFLVDSAAGNYISAIQNLSLTKRLDDTIYKASKVNDLQQLMVQYDAKNKNEQIKLLKQKEVLQDANLKEANIVRDLTIGGILVLLAVASLFYRQYQQKQKNSALISLKNQQLERLLVEKEWLLKEVHHRVKNNLYTVICLLEIQSEFLKDDALKAIENCQHRIYAMSLLHQKLYLAEDVKTINMADYLPDLIQYLKESLEVKTCIIFELTIPPLHLDISQAMPLGLIINEAVSNSIKYAFPGKKNGTIIIKIEVVNKEVTIIIADNGIGFTQQTELSKINSLGLKLIRGLSEDINARVNFEHEGGTRITIIFTPVQLAETEINTKINKESEAF
jgi:two-component system, sensor histidine kinase PdtaS